jgi:hypothetical protein
MSETDEEWRARQAREDVYDQAKLAVAKAQTMVRHDQEDREDAKKYGFVQAKDGSWKKR